MKITGIRTYKFSVPTGRDTRDPRTGALLSSPSKAWLLLRIDTDAGIAGWGEGSGEWLVPSVEATLHEWTGLLVGRDPLGAAALTADIADRLPWKGGPVFGTAIAAIDIALHDIAGRAWGVPIHTLLGGRRRDRIRVYGGAPIGDIRTAVDEALALRAAGYAGIKGNPLEQRRWPLDGAAIDHSAAVVGAIREAVGPDFEIMLDTHGSPQPELSVQFARAIARWRPLFLEEPCKVGSLEALLEVSRHSPVPVAAGEKLFALRDFRPLLERRACAILQPDIGHCFGFTTFMQIASRAEEQQMLMAPHLGVGGILYVASLHAGAATPNFLIQESPSLAGFDRFLEHDLVIRDGCISIPGGPGLGVEVKEADIARMPYEPMPYRQYRHEDGSWKGW